MFEDTFLGMISKHPSGHVHCALQSAPFGNKSTPSRFFLERSGKVQASICFLGVIWPGWPGWPGWHMPALPLPSLPAKRRRPRALSDSFPSRTRTAECEADWSREQGPALGVQNPSPYTGEVTLDVATTVLDYKAHPTRCSHVLSFQDRVRMSV